MKSAHCPFCYWFRGANNKERLEMLVSVFTGWHSLIFLICIGISIIVSLLKDTSLAGCSLVAMAIALEGWNRFNEQFQVSQEKLVDHSHKSAKGVAAMLATNSVGPITAVNYDGPGTSKQVTPDQMVKEVDQRFEGKKEKVVQKFAVRKHYVTQLLLAFIGTLLWGFSQSCSACL